jgi:hypothetical protein
MFCAVLSSFAAPAYAKEHCLPIKAHLKTTFGPCPKDFESPIGLCSSGKLTGWFGTAMTRFRATNAAYSAGLPDTEAPTTLSYTGELEVVDYRGKILFREVGLNDSAHAIFSELSRLWSATGAYNGMVGRLFITGTASEDGLTFNAEVRGKLCR